YPVAMIIKNALLPAFIPLQDALTEFVSNLVPLVQEFIIWMQDRLLFIGPVLSALSNTIRVLLEVAKDVGAIDVLGYSLMGLAGTYLALRVSLSLLTAAQIIYKATVSLITVAKNAYRVAVDGSTLAVY